MILRYAPQANLPGQAASGTPDDAFTAGNAYRMTHFLSELDPTSSASALAGTSLLAGQPLAALDLFAGIGGFSAGFRDEGFAMTGVDSEPIAKAVYESSGFGVAVTHDLAEEIFVKEVPVVLGGPPCTPWSPVNLQRRSTAHNDHGLLDRFFKNVLEIRPLLMLMENVPAVGSDRAYYDGLTQLRAEGYDVESAVVRYSDFGAATKRRRLFTIGIRGTKVGARTFFDLLSECLQPAQTVREAIGWLRNKGCGEVPDHDWSRLRTIGNYRHLYLSGKYGWARLEYDEPAPSFGSVAKTYILHPEAGIGGFPERVLSVREVMCIMGFDSSVAFPAKSSRAKRYQMTANTVSPVVSRHAAAVVRYLLTGDSGGRPFGRDPEQFALQIERSGPYPVDHVQG